MKVNPNIFKEYDVRGKYPQEINAKVAYQIGRGFVKFLKLGKSGKIVIARDKRPSSPKLAKAFVSGVLDSGINVIDIGEATTPMLYFAVPFLKARGGAMITASHLAKNRNGIKFVREKSEPIGGLEIKQIINLKNKPVKQKGTHTKFNIKKDYLEAMLGNFKLNRISIPYSFDYDGDRLIVKGEDNKEIQGDIIGGIIGDSILKKGDVLVYDLRCSRRIPEYFENKGITAMPCKVGRPNIERIMRKKKAVFGMELVGHYHFKKFDYCLSPLYALKILIEQTEKTGKTLVELAKPFMKYCHSGVINFPAPRRTEKILEKLKEKYRNGAQNSLDGLTIEFSNWWFNVRQSHTEPLIRMVVETNTPELLEQKKKELMKKIKKIT